MQIKTNIKTAKGRKLSSTKWLYRHINDPYVASANEKGYKSRAAFKLLEIDQKFKILSHAIKNGAAIIDLGCAPGSWLQVLNEKLHKLHKYKIIGVDLKVITCDNISNIKIITGDFTHVETTDMLRDNIKDYTVQLVLSDMASNSCGDRQIDHLRITSLAHEVLDFIESNGQYGCNAVIKVVQGNMSKILNDRAKGMFHKVHWYKPKASYADSAEIYLIMLNKKT